MAEARDEMDFRASAQLSVGIELELQLVRPHDLDLSRDDAFGTTRSVSSLTTYLTPARRGGDPMKVALDFVGAEGYAKPSA